MFDCNWLKEINDAYGHERGDIYLRATSHAICETFTHSPVFRLGGDEFATLLQGSDYKHRDELLQAFDKKTEEVAATVSHPWEKVDVAIRPSVLISAAQVTKPGVGMLKI